MLKALLKWCVAGFSGLLAVVVLIGVISMVVVPIKDALKSYITERAGYGGPETLPIVDLSVGQGGIGSSAWVEPAGPEHCEFTISGVVTRQDGIPIEDAEINVHNTGVFESGEHRYTDPRGRFRYTEFGVDTCDKEEFYVSVSKNGYQPFFLVARPGQELDITLTSILFQAARPDN